MQIDIGSQRHLDNIEGHHDWLRRTSPVHTTNIDNEKRTEVVVVSRYEDCRTVLSSEVFRSATSTGSPMPMPEYLRLMTSSSMLMKDDREHRRLRRLVSKPFTPRAIRRLAGRVGTLVDRLLDEADTHRVIDLQRVLAEPVPTTIIDQMVGIPDDQRADFHAGIHAIKEEIEGGNRFTPDERDAAAQMLVRLLRELIDMRRSEPADDIMSALVQIDDEDGPDTEELLAMAFTLITAGYETTHHLITNSVATLLQHPEQLRLLREHPHLMRSAVDEVLRYAGPVMGLKPSIPTQDIVVRDTLIPAGSLVIPLVAAANRDPDAFERPETFDVRRSPNRHLGLGYGPHVCLGAGLAYLQTSTFLQVLLDRHPDLLLAVDSTELRLERTPLWFRYEGLPVVLG